MNGRFICNRKNNDVFILHFVSHMSFLSIKERIVARCLEKGLAIYSPHTSYDALQGGVNDWLIQAFGKCNDELTELVV